MRKFFAHQKKGALTFFLRLQILKIYTVCPFLRYYTHTWGHAINFGAHQPQEAVKRQ